MQLGEARKRDALEMRLRGHNYREIGEALGVTAEAARLAVQRGMTEIKTQSAETGVEVREQEAARLDAMLVRLSRMADDTQDDATVLAIHDRMMRVQERRAKLLGLDLQRLEVTGAGGGPIQIAQIQRVIVDAPTPVVATVLEAQALPAPSVDAVPRDDDAMVISRRGTEDEGAT